MKLSRLSILTGLLLLFSLGACNMSLSKGTLTIPITLDEKAVTRLVEGVQGIITAASPDQPNVTINHIDFIVPDSVRVDGTYEISENNFTQGHMQIAFGVVDDLPRIEVTELNAPGIENSDSLLSQINQTLTDSLVREVGAIQEKAVFKSISVEENAIKIIVEVPLTSKSE